MSECLLIRDLDSLASSIAYSFLASTLLASRTIPLSLTPTKYMNLRQENLLAFRYAHIDPLSLVHPDTLPAVDGRGAAGLGDLAGLGVEFALVDHNHLLPMFGDGKVNAVIDHHEDDHAHEDASIRLIQFPTGSCSSLVTKQFRPQWEASISGPAGKASGPIPPELATLLLSAILIDTAALKAGGKAMPTDMESAEFLYPLSNIPQAADALRPTAEAASDNFAKVYESLSTAKEDVSALNTQELLLRDYKEYHLQTASTAFPLLRAGLSSVPVAFKDWLDREDGLWKNLLEEVDKYMEERGLDICGVLTSYHNAKGKHKREIALFTRSAGALRSHEEAKTVMDILADGFENSDVLSLKDWGGPVMTLLARKTTADDETQGRYGRVWKQSNSKATRKQVAPLLHEVVSRIS